MPKPVSLSYTFGTQTSPIRLSYLDTNFTSLLTAMNDTLTYSNYLLDVGTANAYVVAFAGSLTTSYTAGLLIQFRIANANTGASTLNVNSLGAKSIVNTNGSALVAGQLPANGIAIVQYDGTNFQLLNDPSAGQVLPTPLPVSQGGTGNTAVPTNGQLLIGNGTGYTLSTLTAGAGMAISNGAGSITLTSAGGAGLPTLSIVTGTSQAAATGFHYALTNAAASTLTLPATPSAGDLVWVSTTNGLATNVVARNGNNIQATAANFTLTTPYSSYQFRYINATIGWAVLGFGPAQGGAQDYIVQSYGIV